MGVSIEDINNIASSQSSYLIIFLLLLAYVLKSSQIREKEMREQLNKSIPVLEKILVRLDIIEDKIER